MDDDHDVNVTSNDLSNWGATKLFGLLSQQARQRPLNHMLIQGPVTLPSILDGKSPPSCPFHLLAQP